jgi:glycerophosphoryl diester phosphodiesterase
VAVRHQGHHQLTGHDQISWDTAPGDDEDTLAVVAGLVVHTYTFRAQNCFLPVDYRTSAVPIDFGRAIDEQVIYLQVGIDGVFTDQADIGVVARAEFRATAPR